MLPKHLGGCRYIPAEVAAKRQWGSFPYYTARLEEEGQEREVDSAKGDDAPVALGLSTPEEDAQRLVDVEQVIYQKLQMAEAQAQEIARQAYEEGFTAGEAEGRKFGESQFKAISEHFQQQLSTITQAANWVSHASQEELLALCLAVGEYLAGQQILFSREGIRDLIDRVMAMNTPTSLVDIYMNPKDRELLGDHFLDHAQVRLLDDPELSRGSLRTHCAEGVLEATLERRKEKVLDLIQRFKQGSL